MCSFTWRGAVRGIQRILCSFAYLFIVCCLFSATLLLCIDIYVGMLPYCTMFAVLSIHFYEVGQHRMYNKLVCHCCCLFCLRRSCCAYDVGMLFADVDMMCI